MSDKVIEKKRYDRRAKLYLQKNKGKNLNNFLQPSYLRVPNDYYFNVLKKIKKKKLLEIGAGTGENTEQLLKMSFRVCATDISPESVKVMNLKFSKYKNFSSKVIDMEKLPFKDKSFDVICSAGSLSYGDNNLVMKEVYRVLKVGGNLVIVDSLNDNLIYKFNRYINYLMGRRSLSTLRRMPNLNLINQFIKEFGYGRVKFFGSLTWVFPILRLVLSEKLIFKFSNWFDKKFRIKKSAFKFVLILKKNNK